MCLIPIGGGMGGPVMEGTPRANKLWTYCYICAGVHAALAVFLMFSGGGDG